ncbi:MAG: hypothetical protein ACI856_000207 [Kiritimatiellia bacterium]|jgi:hypothetical protein
MYSTDIKKESLPRRCAVRAWLLAACFSAILPPQATIAMPQAAKDSAELTALYGRLPEHQHAAADFLIENMPAHDASSLSADFLAEHITYAFKAREQFSWAKDVPDDLFLNDVLPYASLNEKRDAWRKMFFENFKTSVADCMTKTEVALILNKAIFDRLNVRYARDRPKPDQSPQESISASKASCTGLSIMMVDACRALGVPARVVGTPQWATSAGNHTWVEIWDDGWHFLGASESTTLNQAWFKTKAGEQIAGDVTRAIYATSFKRTGLHFPLVWDRSIRYVSAIDVTDSYAADNKRLASIDSVKTLLSEGPLLGLLDKADIPLPAQHLEQVINLVWTKYSDAIKGSAIRSKEHQNKAVSYHGKTMRYAYTRVGKKPDGGYPLYIALHGGGGAPTRVNDAQWEHMKVYYRDSVTSGIYLAPRGVTDTWNLHWLPESFACYDRIIENMIVFENVNPNKVYLLGYSAGGDAAYSVPARAADRWAAAAMSAGHPNGVRPDNYASLAFLIQVGARDAAYKRNKVAAEYHVKLEALRAAHPEHYTHATYIHAGRGHGFMDHAPNGAPQKVFSNPAEWLKKEANASTTNVNANAIHWLGDYTRDPTPKKVIWDCGTMVDRSGNLEPGFWPTGEKSKLHYWLGLDRYDNDVPLDAERIVAEFDKPSNSITVSELGNFVRFYLNSQMLDLTKKVTVLVDGHALTAMPQPNLRTVIQTLLDRGDPNYIFPACLTLSKNPEGTWMLE